MGRFPVSHRLVARSACANEAETRSGISAAEASDRKAIYGQELIRIATVTICTLLGVLLCGPTAFAESAEQEFSNFLAEIQSFNATAEPIASPVLMRFEPVTGVTSKVRTVVRTENIGTNAAPIFIAVQTIKNFDRIALDNGDLETTTVFEIGDVKSQGARKPSMSSTLPEGTKVVAINSPIGILKDVTLVPRTTADAALLPNQGTAEFDQIVKNAVNETSPFPAQPVSQGAAISGPVLYPIGLPADAFTHTGKPPYLAGTVKCGEEDCLLILIDEAMDSKPVSPGVNISATAKGYYLLSRRSFLTIETRLWTHSEVRTPTQHQSQDIIVIGHTTTN